MSATPHDRDDRPVEYRLAEALAARFQAVVPEWVTVSADDDRIVIAGRQWWTSSVFTDSGWPEHELAGHAAGIASNMLNSFQDFISEQDTWPWPRVEGHPTAMPAYHAELRGHTLVMWYGDDEGAPVLRLEPLDLRDVGIASVAPAETRD